MKINLADLLEGNRDAKPIVLKAREGEPTRIIAEGDLEIAATGRVIIRGAQGVDLNPPFARDTP